MIATNTKDIWLNKLIIVLTIYGAFSMAYDLKKLIMYIITTL